MVELAIAGASFLVVVTILSIGLWLSHKED